MKKLYILIVIFSFLFPLTAQATVAGKVVYHSGEAWALRNGERVGLQQGVEVHSGDVIVTTMHGRAKLSMVDDSVVYVGRQSRITIDRYDMRGESLFSGSFNMLWGKVRFLVTKLHGSGADFSVRTKTATIGVRGTQFAVLVNPPSVVPKPSVKVPDSALLNVPTTVMLFEGAVVGRSIKGQVINIKPGTIVRLKPNGAILSRKIQKHDMKVLDIEPLAPGKGAPQPGKGVLRSPAKPEPTKSPARPEPGGVLTSPARLEPATTLAPPTKLERGGTLTSPAKLEPATTLAPPTRLDPVTTVPTKLEPVTTAPTKLAPVTTVPTRLDPVVAPKLDRVIAPPPPPPPPPPTVNRGSLPVGAINKSIGRGTIKRP
ncbi:MAG: FecR domain-containing protein [Mariprofundaceae bacterium]|nr:FecR domain-containing protein [Mariprofundaceae bacterium]